MHGTEKLPLTESEQILRDNRELLQKTAREQDLIDGGDGTVFYVFTIQDTVDLAWKEGVPPSKNIRQLFNGKK